MADILVLYYSRNGMTEALAREVCHGIDGVTGMAARLRTVAEVSAVSETLADAVPASGPPYATPADIAECAGLVMGSPTNFGNMSAALKHFLDGTIGEWFKGAAAGKPAGVFASTSSLHGGQESTLLSMMLPLIHHGMLILGVPYSSTELLHTRSGGTPYGCSHLAGVDSKLELTEDEKSLCRQQGKRLAKAASLLCPANLERPLR